jgi:hypothetical protein
MPHWKHDVAQDFHFSFRGNAVIAAFLDSVFGYVLIMLALIQLVWVVKMLKTGVIN